MHWTRWSPSWSRSRLKCARCRRRCRRSSQTSSPARSRASPSADSSPPLRWQRRYDRSTGCARPSSAGRQTRGQARPAADPLAIVGLVVVALPALLGTWDARAESASEPRGPDTPSATPAARARRHGGACRHHRGRCPRARGRARHRGSHASGRGEPGRGAPASEGAGHAANRRGQRSGRIRPAIPIGTDERGPLSPTFDPENPYR